MEKPITMPLKEFLIKKLSLSTMVPAHVVKTIVDFQFTEGFKATNEKNSIEFSGLGKFLFASKKAKKKLENYKRLNVFYIKELEKDITPAKRRNLEKRLAMVERDIEFLKLKLREDENQSDI